jgi:hypothetical protein
MHGSVSPGWKDTSLQSASLTTTSSIVKHGLPAVLLPQLLMFMLKGQADLAV